MKAIIEINPFGIIEIALDEEHAPLSVDNFVSLAKKGFYNGLSFHRVIKGFMIQGGCPKGNGTGGPGYAIKGEFAANGVNNPLKHLRGTISMARSREYDSAGSQFFIVHEDAPHLDGQYAAFGRVVKGMEVVDAIASVKTNYLDRPLDRVTIKSVKII
ncbi:MAG TPA: peptidylprolyl isomerase [Erysipelotrichaceae bacterium]|nr:peptidylprolyl isomerase [Erysipelotrichaceae bacterium]